MKFIRFGKLHVAGVAMTCLLLALLIYAQLLWELECGLLEPGLYVYVTSEFSFMMSFLALIVLTFITYLLHELIHYIVGRLLHVKSLSVKVISLRLKMLEVPVGLMICYAQCTVRRYLAIALAPQALTMLLFIASVVSPEVIVLYGTIRLFPRILFFILYSSLLVASGGDFYGIIYVLLRVRDLNAVMSTLVKDGRIIGVMIKNK
ncbi:MAG: hypothetical protein DRN15_10665 [Thermoprotei archaeon]|nr:MAG: hypothetical protein DRN15_10665 [Thermoprotei archaeon]RLF21762.1 MAG: hypothetical protein DRM97_06335 [Thermoprotei archaeon]